MPGYDPRGPFDEEGVPDDGNSDGADSGVIRQVDKWDYRPVKGRPDMPPQEPSEIWGDHRRQRPREYHESRKSGSKGGHSHSRGPRSSRHHTSRDPERDRDQDRDRSRKSRGSKGSHGIVDKVTTFATEFLGLRSSTSSPRETRDSDRHRDHRDSSNRNRERDHDHPPRRSTYDQPSSRRDQPRERMAASQPELTYWSYRPDSPVPNPGYSRADPLYAHPVHGRRKNRPSSGL